MTIQDSSIYRTIPATIAVTLVGSAPELMACRPGDCAWLAADCRIEASLSSIGFALRQPIHGGIQFVNITCRR